MVIVGLPLRMVGMSFLLFAFSEEGRVPIRLHPVLPKQAHLNIVFH